MKLHHYFRMFSKTIEDEVAWLFRHFHEPVEAFKPKVRDVHVDTAMSINQSQPNIVRPNLSLYWKLSQLDCLIDPRDLLFRNIFLQVRVVDLEDFKTCKLCIFNDVQGTQLIRSWSIINPSVPEHPNFLWKSLPSCKISWRNGFLRVWFDKIYSLAEVKLIMDE